MMEMPHLFPNVVTPYEHDHGCKVLPPLPMGWRVSAIFDGPGDCYRYKLVHRWSDAPLILWAMTNPSGAGVDRGDMTVMKTSRIAIRLGFGGQIIVNACAHRHVNPKQLLAAGDPVGPRNLSTIREAAMEANMIVVAHGRLPTPALQEHAAAMVQALRSSGKPLHILRMTPDGCPMHPLARGKAYIPEDVVPQRWDLS